MSTVLEWPSIVCTVLRSLPAIKLAGRAVAQVIQPDRRQVDIADQAVEQLAEPVGFDRVTAGVGEHEPAHVALEAVVAWWRSRTVSRSSAIRRTLPVVLVSIRPRRIAALSATRRVTRMRCRVEAARARP